MKPKASIAITTKITKGGAGVPRQALARAVSKAAAETIAKSKAGHRKRK